MSEGVHPVLAHLRRFTDNGLRRGWFTSGMMAAEAVMIHGQAYVGIDRPKGYRHQRARKQCFMNATSAAIDGRGAYVEGFAATPDTGVPMLHAWITLDGVHAIDQTWRDAPSCHYYGIRFSTEVLSRVICGRNHYGLLDPMDYDLLTLARPSRGSVP